jgi:hypothetical protein
MLTVSLAGVINTHPAPLLFLKPRVKTSEEKSPILLIGKLTTQQTNIPSNSSFVCAPTACTLDDLIPISEPKSIFSLKAGLIASG